MTRTSRPQNAKSIIDQTKLPPQNLEAEKGILGSMLLDKETINRVADFLQPEDFYSRAHQLIYEHMVKLYEKREPIDVLSVTNSLKGAKVLEDVGGSGYLTTLVNSVPTSAHAVNYARIVERKKIMRDMIDKANEIIGLGHKEEEDIEDLLDQAEQKLFSISQRSIQQHFQHIDSSLHQAFERLDKLHKGEGTLRGHATGFVDIDNITSGLQGSNLIILAARPSLGKTTFVLDIARHIGREAPVGVFTIEMSREEVTDRFIAAESGVSLWKMRTGRLSSEGENNDFEKIGSALDGLAKSKIFIEDSASPTVLQMRAMARRLQAEHGLGLIIVDYLQLIRPNKNYDSPVQQITEISRNLKSLARELNVPVLAVSQLSRAVESRTDQRPKLSDLRDSGSIEQDADLVMFIYREDRVKPDSDKKNVAEIMIAKHRNGPTGSVELYFDEDQVSFKNLAKNF
ncbi:MAG: replicative DNA helicase [Parcubacteria group bacterium]